MSLSDLTLFNVHDGYCEAIVRGFRSGFLTDVEYHHLTECATMEDLKQNLQETDYGNFLQNEPSPIAPSTVHERCVGKLAKEFDYLRSCAVGDLATFLDFIKYEYMIENVMLLLKGTMDNPDVNVDELMAQCHPLGMFDAAIMRSICAFENTPQGYMDLYEVVLIELPVGKYFAQFLVDQTLLSRSGVEVRSILEEVALPVLESSVLKLYLEDFHQFCQRLGGETAAVMGELLAARADAMSVNITLNSFNTPLNEETHREDRRGLYPAIGTMYPGGVDLLANAHTEADLADSLRRYPEFHRIWEAASESEERTIDDLFFARDVRLMENAFGGQFHYGSFYAYVKLKEQEVRNLVWISECIVQHRRDRINKFIPIFSSTAPWRRGQLF